MRALCGSIIAAGALIGLGLFSIGLGQRYQGQPYRGKDAFVKFIELDTSLMIAFVVLLAAALVGLGIAFVGLAYHHERRHYERLHLAGGKIVERETH